MPVGIIINSPEKHAQNKRREQIERAQSQGKKPGMKRYVQTGAVGDLKIKESHSPSGNKMIVVEDSNSQKDKREKQKFIRETYGENPTKNGHGTVITMGDAD